MTTTTDIIPETAAEALRKWDAGESVFSIEMGGLGPGYEQCIQILAFEIIRAWLPTVPWPPLQVEGRTKEEDEAAHKELSDRLEALSDPVISALDKENGFSGAQVGAAQNLASCVLRRGYRAALRDPAVADRMIQVSRKMPKAPPPPESDLSMNWPEPKPPPHPDDVPVEDEDQT